MLSEFLTKKTQLLWQTEVVNVQNEHLFEDADLPEQKIGGDDPMFHSKKKQNTGFLPRRKRENLQATRPFDPSGNGICHAEPGSRSNTVIQKT